MICTFAVISIKSLLQEHPLLCYSFPPTDPLLETSISEFGIMSPLLVRKSGDAYFVLSGFRRLNIALKLNLKEIPVLICDMDNVTALRCSLSENTSRRPLNIFEKAALLDILLNVLTLPEQTVIRDYLPLLGLNTHRSVVDKIVPVNKLSVQQKTSLYHAGIEEDKILSLRLADSDTYDTFIALLIHLKPGINKFNQIIELVTEISRRDKKSMRTICDELKFDELIHSEDHPASQRLNMLRMALQDRRNPAVSATENYISAKLHALKLPAGVRLSTPNLCENTNITMDISIKSPESLKQIAEKLAVMSDNPALSDIFNCLKGDLS
ncbi:MAG: hypothetical protein C4541_01560 [Candidatus Auribacter fodinae]|uniref:ParB-like N-terminal domain-containing protein n=1 Tax=Candidatus Auribacter fodinae TaxID=2093366 RepID=A0A3A4RFM3_9BACT|nr:MAG: hypothetical protein C4541_01560 [Candidatus Auribacter fodinae]